MKKPASLLFVAALIACTTAVADDRPFGIEKRVPWTTSRITGSPQPPAPYSIERVFPALSFKNPVLLTPAPGTDRLFVAEVNGKIYSFENKPDVAEPDLFIDLAKEIEGVRRVYGLAFHPDFEDNRYCYICYVLEEKNPEGTRVSRFKVSKTDPPIVDPASEEIVITWLSGGHNGGCLKFGTDGCLYISTGDGGPAFPPDPLKSGQDITNLLSCILRIDVDKPDGDRLYSIPSGNPFVEVKGPDGEVVNNPFFDAVEGARGEVWAYGFRNPWRMSFDPVTNDLWVGDVGWELWEMIYRVEEGGNYGWSLVEASQPVHRERPRGPTPILPPTIAHSHIESRSITGGFVYRGRRMRELKGVYVYGDYVTGIMWGLRHDGAKVTWQAQLVDTPLQIICFGVDHDQELYVVDYGGGIYRLVPNEAAAANEKFPTKLSETGLFSSVKDHAVAPGVISYSINAEPWADGTWAQRLLALPGESKLGVYESSNAQIGYLKGHWKFPKDAVLAKTISYTATPDDPSGGRRLETQILHFDVDTWRGYTYIWNDEQTDATLAPAEGLDRQLTISDADAPRVRKQSWRFASRNECILCHTTRGGTVYGFTKEQLNKDHMYAEHTDNQLRTLSHIGVFETPVDAAQTPTMPKPHEESASLEERARAYLHVNCSHCHLRGGGGTAAIEIQIDRPLDKTNLLGARPTQGTFGIHGAEIISPGIPEQSVLYYRMSKVGRGRMPYFGSSTIDEAGVKLIYDWIASMPQREVSDAYALATGIDAANIQKLRGSASENAKTKSIDALLSTTSGALRLQRAYAALDRTTRQRVLTVATSHADAQIRDLFERFLPDEKRSKRLGSSIDPAKILALRGSAEQGRKLFFETTTVQCKNCHQIGDRGTALGPALTQIGKELDRTALLESILHPSKQIDPKFVSYVCETAAGQVHTGFLIEKNDKQIVLKDAQNKRLAIPADEVEFLTVSQKSIMPELLLRDMTAEQVADLLEYLGSLKGN